MKSHMITAALATALTFGAFTGVKAATVVKDTYVKQQEIDGTIKVNFAEFDQNKDGNLSRNEVGSKLFYIFDTDGNEVIDNIEYNLPMVITLIPMEKEEITTIDFNDDGKPDNSHINQEEFIKKSMLYKFDQHKDGLSAKDFLNQVYWQLDDNKDRTVDIKEWKEAYNESTSPSAANPNRYNQ